MIQILLLCHESTEFTKMSMDTPNCIRKKKSGCRKTKVESEQLHLSLARIVDYDFDLLNVYNFMSKNIDILRIIFKV